MLTGKFKSVAYLSILSNPKHNLNLRDALFSYDKASEAFLQRVMSLMVSSHYKVKSDVLFTSASPHSCNFIVYF